MSTVEQWTVEFWQACRMEVFTAFLNASGIDLRNATRPDDNVSGYSDIRSNPWIFVYIFFYHVLVYYIHTKQLASEATISNEVGCMTLQTHFIFILELLPFWFWKTWMWLCSCSCLYSLIDCSQDPVPRDFCVLRKSMKSLERPLLKTISSATLPSIRGSYLLHYKYVNIQI